MEIVLKVAGSGYCFGFFIAFWMIGKKFYRGLRYSSRFWKSTPVEKAIAIIVAFVMTAILSIGWLVVVSYYLAKLYLDDRKW